jgi:hypothetical protein
VLATGTTPGAANTNHTASAVNTAQAQADLPVARTASGGEESDRVEGQGWAAEQQATPQAGLQHLLAPDRLISRFVSSRQHPRQACSPPHLCYPLRDGPEGASLQSTPSS